MLRMMMMTLSLVVTIVVYATVNLLPLNEGTTWELAHRLPVLFTPASYVFSIWAVIYILLAFWIVDFRQIHRNVDLTMRNRRAFLFIFSCIFNIAWIFLWHSEHFNWMIISKLMLLVLLLGLYFTYPKMENRLFGRIPISVYLGWTFISMITNTSYVLTLRGWSGWGLSDPLWTVIYLTIGTAIALHFMYHHGDFMLNAVFVWTFIGIAVKNGVDELFVSTAALFLSAVIFFGFSMMKKKTSTTD